jgi:peroxiredoxin
MKSIVRALLLATIFLANAAQARPVKVGEPAPDFTLTLLDGSKVTLADLKGQVVVLNFWATWCVPCRKELPLLDNYYSIQKPHGLSIFAVEDQDEGSVPMIRLKAFLNKIRMPSALRIKGPYKPMEGVPTNYVIDRAGVVRYAKAAAFDLDALNEILVPLLREEAPEEPAKLQITAR